MRSANLLKQVRLLPSQEAGWRYDEEAFTRAVAMGRDSLEPKAEPVVLRRQVMRRVQHAVLIALCFWIAFPLRAETNARPNFLIVVADDLGWSDLGCYGNTFIDTPHLDALARDGLRFEQAYASPVCAPSRAAMQTGRHEARLKMTDVPNGHRRPWERLIPPEYRWQLPTSEVTLAEALSPGGYAAGLFGKWHLGFRRGHQPVDQGYVRPPTEALTGHYAKELERWVAANPEKAIGSQLMQSVKFIESQREGPFLCIASFTSVHTPLEARAELVEKYRKRAARVRTPVDPTYAAMVEVLDEAVGWLRRVLHEQKLAENTLIFFLSDNGGVIEERGFLPGGAPGLVTHNWPLRGEKGQLYEGGIRVPWIAHWPGRVTAGKTSSALVHVVDILPTLRELAGLPPMGTDGVSLTPSMRDAGNPVAEDRALYWHYPHYHHSVPASAVRVGRHKLIHFHDTGVSELYNLADDSGERWNLAPDRPAEVAALERRLRDWFNEVDAGMPRANPWFDPARRLLWGERVSRILMADDSVPLGLP